MRVPACPVIAALRRHELVNGGQRLRGARGDVNLAAPRKRIELISNRVLFPGHGSDTGHFAHVDKRRRVEVASGESKGNLSQVLTNLSNLRRIALIALQFDAAAVGECIKAVGGRVLVHAHCHTATRLECSESRVTLLVRRCLDLRRRVRSARAEGTEGQDAEHEVTHREALLCGRARNAVRGTPPRAYRLPTGT